ncbi:MAG TPA: glycosyltransferase 87 family protein [Gaiellaceae bacterium]|nr:glycosyltransferase 87 family protein [Gaiellaceae bacterium]
MSSRAGVVQTWSDDRRPASRRGVLTVALVFLAVLWTAGLAGMSAAEQLLAWDVRFAYLPAADAILAGDSPYPALDDPILEEQKGYVYPPQVVVAFLPLAWLPVDVAALLAAIGLVALVVLTLRALDVEDVRCYAAAFLWMPTTSGILLGNVSLALALALALAWRWRDDARRAGAALGIAVSAKLLLWPLLVWTAATRRVRATATAVAAGVAVTAAAWAAIGFAGLVDYPDLLRRLSDIQAENSYSFVGVAATLGLGETVGHAVVLGVGAALLAGCVSFARRGDDVRSFTCAVAATLALSPIVWLHYLVLLLVPLAIARPRFSPLWLLPVLLWTSPRPGYSEGVQVFPPAIVGAILVVLLLRGGRRARGAAGAAVA